MQTTPVISLQRLCYMHTHFYHTWHSTCVPQLLCLLILHCFPDTVTYWWKITFWATICKRVRQTVRPVLLLSCPVCDVGVLWPNGWMDQDATWHGDRPRPGHIVLDGDPALSKRVRAPIFGLCLLWPNGWIDQDDTSLVLGSKKDPHLSLWIIKKFFFGIWQCLFVTSLGYGVCAK